MSADAASSSEALTMNLPHALTSFIGRKRELTEVKALLSHTRLLTLTGAGGCGKTRLALQVAADLAETFPHGVVWVELAALSDPALVPQAVATVLEMREAPDEPLVQTLARTLQPRRVLLVLDNCEHVLAACAQLAEALLHACPRLRILTTSRRPLGIMGESVWLVPSLSLPGEGRMTNDEGHIPNDHSSFVIRLSSSEAVQLFVERAAAVRPGFVLAPENAGAVAQICRRLDGLPLALELAAARVRVLTVGQIAARLDDRFNLLTSGNRTALIPRHQTLRAAIDWSYDLLSEPERVVFRRLSAFAGGFTLGAVEAVCAGDDRRQTTDDSSVVHRPSSVVRRPDVLDLLSELVDKSLVVVAEMQEPREARYRLLETIRGYAWEKLLTSGEAEALRRRHAGHYLALAERADPELKGAHQALWLNRLEQEHDNLRAALEWSLGDGDAETGLRLGVALWRFWFAHGHLSEGRRWLARALERNPHAPAAVRALALQGAGRLAWRQGDYASARSFTEQSLALRRALGDPWEIAAALYGVASVALAQRDYTEARSLLEECLAQSRELGHKQGIAWAVNALGELARDQGDGAQAGERYHEALALFQDIGDAHGMAMSLANLGFLALHHGDDTRAAALFGESLDLARQREDKTYMAIALTGLAGVAIVRGWAVHAVRLLGAAAALLDRIGAQLEPADRADYDRTLAAVRTALGDEAFAAAWAEGRALTVDQAIALALDVKDQAFRARLTITGQPTPELRLLALGPALVYRGEQALGPAEWRYARARELLFFLLSHSSATKEEIGLAFWPDASPTQLRNNLGVSLYHLRRALGRPEWIVFADEHYAFNRSLAYWFDLEAFEAHLTQANRLRGAAPEQAIPHLDEAIKLYRGDFLADFSQGDWFLLQREELRRRHLEALLSLGQLLFDQAQYAQASQVYRWALVQDSYLEAAHRQLMRCYARLGERGQALRHYQMLVALMRDELGAAPAPETTALYERLRRGEE